MGVERVSVESNFFDDLGADSMVMARFCARVRKRPELPAVSIKDIYQHPTIKSLATALGGDSPVPVDQRLDLGRVAGSDLGRGARLRPRSRWRNRRGRRRSSSAGRYSS